MKTARLLVILLTVPLTACGVSTQTATRTADHPTRHRHHHRHHGQQGGGGKITLSGQVGSLRLDRSTRAQVVAFAGRPAATGTGQFPGVAIPMKGGHHPLPPAYLALGYTCHGRSRDLEAACQTVFFLNTLTHRLVGFRTTSRGYSFRGARVGMSTKRVSRELHAPPPYGCWNGYSFFGHQGADLVGTAQGDRLGVLALESSRDPVGVLFC